MNTVDLINKVARENDLTLGRAEMIYNIIIERIIDNLRTGNSVLIPGFGEFNIISADQRPGIQIYDKPSSGKYFINFKPEPVFNQILNS